MSLRGARPGADHRHLLAGELHGLLRPLARVVGLAPIPFPPGDRRPVRHRQHAGGRHHETGTKLRPILGGEHPGRAGLVEDGRRDAGAELDEVAQAEVLDDEVQVRLGLGLTGEVLGPVPRPRARREEVPVRVALGVEAGTRVAVPVPRASHVGSRLDQADVETSLTQQMQLVDARDTRPDDDDLGIESRARSTDLRHAVLDRHVRHLPWVGRSSAIPPAPLTIRVRHRRRSVHRHTPRRPSASSSPAPRARHAQR